MIVKKFQAPTEREAIIKAQEELGSTAVVLNVKTIKQRGFAKLFKKDAVEVTAALEEKDFVDGINKSRPSFDNTMNKEQMINRSMVSTGSLPSINLVADDSVNLSSSSTASGAGGQPGNAGCRAGRLHAGSRGRRSAGRLPHPR